MRPAEYPLPVTRGDDISFDFYVRGKDAQGNKTTVDLTGYTLESKFTDSAGNVYPATATFNDATQGYVNVFLSRVTVSSFPKGNGVWYFALINPLGRKTTLLDGTLQLREPGGPR